MQLLSELKPTIIPFHADPSHLIFLPLPHSKKIPKPRKLQKRTLRRKIFEKKIIAPINFCPLKLPASEAIRSAELFHLHQTKTWGRKYHRHWGGHRYSQNSDLDTHQLFPTILSVQLSSQLVSSQRDSSCFCMSSPGTEGATTRKRHLNTGISTPLPDTNSSRSRKI